MRVKNHNAIYKVLDKKADILNNKVPVSQLPNNIVHNGLTGTVPIAETPIVDADGVTLRFTNPHVSLNLSML